MPGVQYSQAVPVWHRRCPWGAMEGETAVKSRGYFVVDLTEKENRMPDHTTDDLAETVRVLHEKLNGRDHSPDMLRAVLGTLDELTQA